MNAELIGEWLSRIRDLLADAQRAGEIGESVDIDLEALAVWAYSAGIGQLGLLHPEWLPAGKQKKLISAYLDKLRP
jgi:hypothetical protein